jgi:hypothetical protein
LKTPAQDDVDARASLLTLPRVVDHLVGYKGESFLDTGMVFSGCVEALLAMDIDDSVDAKCTLMSLPQEWAGYRLQISADPMAWRCYQDDPSGQVYARCLGYAQRLARLAREEFIGLKTVLVGDRVNMIPFGPDAERLIYLDEWMTNNQAKAMLSD